MSDDKYETDAELISDMTWLSASLFDFWDNELDDEYNECDKHLAALHDDDKSNTESG